MNLAQTIKNRVGENPEYYYDDFGSRALWVQGERTISMASTPKGEFGQDWYTDADEIVIDGNTTFFIYYDPRGRGDPVIFNNNGEISIWRYGGGYRLTPMVAGDLGL